MDLPLLSKIPISGLPSATTPLAQATKVVVVQDGETRQANVGDVMLSGVAAPQSFNGATKTLLPADVNLEYLSLSDSAVSLVVDKSAPVGKYIVWQIGAGVITPTPGSGAALGTSALGITTSVQGAPLVILVTSNPDGNSAQFIVAGVGV